MNKITLVIFIFIITIQCKSQNDTLGIFQYKRQVPFFNETLILYFNNSFEYLLKMDMGVSFRNTGNWIRRDNCLILDSYPQKEKIIVWESYKKKEKGITIEVRSKDYNQAIYYHLTAILPGNDTIILRDQYKKSVIEKKPTSFWITNTVGLRSPEYKIKSLETNVINVLFEDERVFENEDWRIIDINKIQPRGLDGNFYNYYLYRVLYQIRKY